MRYENLEQGCRELRSIGAQCICPKDTFFGPLADAIEGLQVVNGQMKPMYDFGKLFYDSLEAICEASTTTPGTENLAIDSYIEMYRQMKAENAQLKERLNEAETDAYEALKGREEIDQLKAENAQLRERLGLRLWLEEGGCMVTANEPNFSDDQWSVFDEHKNLVSTGPTPEDAIRKARESDDNTPEPMEES